MTRDLESRDLAGAAHFAAADAEPPDLPHPSEYEDLPILDLDEFEAAGLYACVVCSENVPRFGTTCERCKRSLEEDRLARESNR